MHNSQNNAALDSDGPNQGLLSNDCLGCHTSTDQSVGIKDPGGARIPVVYNSSGAPTYGEGNMGLAGGNFYWVATDDTKGHNVFSSNPDDHLLDAPGHQVTGCAGPNSCHDNISGLSGGKKQGCTKCHMVKDAMGSSSASGYHHAGSAVPAGGAAINTFPFYRFLTGHNGAENSGVCGWEDNDWQYTYSAGDHNEYIGKEENLATATHSLQNGSMSSFCIGCHANFHIQNEQSDGSGAWIRHPSDAVIPTEREYADISTIYSVNTPVARQITKADAGTMILSGNVAAGSDLVMCLSCHKPHGSPYDDMLRWNYTAMVAGDAGAAEGTGCFYCHTEKDD